MIAVEVYADTGQVRVVRYVVVDDCGRVLNPLLMCGQILSGVSHW